MAARPQYRDAGANLASAAPGLGLDGLGTARLEKHISVRGAAFAALCHLQVVGARCEQLLRRRRGHPPRR